MVETVLDMPVYYYEWRGSSSSNGRRRGSVASTASSSAAAAAAAATQDIPLAADSFIDEYNLSSSLPTNTSSLGRGGTRIRSGGGGGGSSSGFGVAGLYDEQNENLGTGVMDQYLQKKNSTFRPDILPGYHPDDLIDYGWDDFGDTTPNGGGDDDGENSNNNDNDNITSDRKSSTGSKKNTKK